MNFMKKNPRKTAIIGAYGLTLLVVGWLFNKGMPMVLLSWLLLTLALIGIFFIDCVAMLGNYYFGRGQADKAAKLFKFSIAKNTKSPMAYLNYGIYLLRRGGAKEADALFDKALSLTSNIMIVKNIKLSKASGRWVLGDVDGAIALLEGMRKSYDYVNARVLSTLSYMYFLKGDLEQAEALSNAAIEDTPESAAAWDNIGQIRYAQKNLPQAKEAFLKASEYKADLPDSQYYLGLIAREEGDLEKAKEYFSRALACEITTLNTVTRAQIEDAINESAKSNGMDPLASFLPFHIKKSSQS